ncbi:hypothetical protein [Tsukamurella spumae]|uniref:Uncharacterized protein n=1 Tax=Tsukamurella spumae TaxID=44753 RepID=A0A846X506_9ACTN|nr:hypothetical protein [Tsukamurella spumae]NKY20767.1 hypothetical protein [Tsukamurella spumae]
MNEITHLAHSWVTESHHPTSEGVVLYQRCSCGVRRIALVAPECPTVWPEIAAKAG